MTNGSDVEVLGADDVGPADRSTPDLTRERVFETDDVLLVRFRSDGGAVSGWHSHGTRDAYGVVLEGRALIEYGSEAEERAAVPIERDTFVHVPAGLAYRIVNSTDEELVGLLAAVGPGDPVREADETPTARPAATPRTAGPDDLVPTAVLANLTRLTPFPDAAVQQVRGHASGRIESSWHHHGDNDVFGYVIEGEGYVEWGTDEDERKLARAGEWFRVPAGLVHRDVNPSDADQEYVLWLTGSEPRVVDVDGPTAGADTRT